MIVACSMYILCELLGYIATFKLCNSSSCEFEFCLLFCKGASYSCQIAKVYKFKEKELQ
jgi:hypothetical protein